MKKKILLSLLFVAAICCNGFAQYLEPRFQDEVINLTNVANDKYLHHTPSTSSIGLAALTTDHFEEFYAEPTDQSNWYRIKHMMSGKYLTILGFNGELVGMNNYGNANPDAQKFRFVQQTISGRYKIHSKFSSGGVDLILTIDYPNQPGDHLVYLSPNKTTGNDDNQEFDLGLVYPDEDPGSALPTLTDSFPGKKVGIAVLFNGWELSNNGNTNSDVIEHSLTTGIGADEEWVIDYTGENGWYKIRNKQQNKYITITSAVDGALVSLQTDAAYSDEYQQFKFIIQPEGDDVYKIHSKFSVGPVGARRALVLDVPTTATISIRLKKNLPTYGSNQKFVLNKDLPPPASFTSGASIDVSQAKILGKQYYISGFESLALLEPYVVGIDTFVRLQQNPVYGEQSEWTFDDAEEMAPYGKAIRIRYGKTGQYLYLPVASEILAPTEGLKLRLKADRGSTLDRRFMFYISSAQLTLNRFFITTTTGAANTNSSYSFPYAHGQLKLDEDDMLASSDLVLAGDNYYQENEFIINLSLPLNGSFTYSVVTRAHGEMLSDSGITRSNSVLVTTSYADPTVNWHFIPTGDGYYYIQNALTKYFIYSTSDGHLRTAAAYLASNPNYKFLLTRVGNYFHISNLATGRFIYATDDTAEGALVDMNVNITNWAISRTDYFSDPLIGPIPAENLLVNIMPSAQNATNDLSYRNKMLRNIGLPFDPVYQSTQPVAAFVFSTEGISLSPVPDFYAVVKSAIKWKFSYTDALTNIAISNYKLDVPGHRTQVAYGLMSYIMDHLANLDRNTQWTANEKELVGWIERKIKSRHDQFADNLSQSWLDFKILYGLGDELGFSVLLDGGGPNPDDYHQPEYFLADSAQSVSLMEFSTVSTAFGYKRPAVLAGLTSPSMVATGGYLLTCVTLEHTALETAELAATAAQELTVELSSAGRSTLTMAAQDLASETSSTFNILKNTTSLSGAAFVASVVAIATQILAMKVTDGLRFQHYNDAINAKTNKLLNTPVNVNTIMKGDNIMDQFYLAMDLEILLGSGARVNYQAITATNPQPVEVQCISAIPAADNNVITGTGGGCGTLSVNLFFETNNGGTGTGFNPYIVTRIYRVADECGNYVDMSHILTARDTTKPIANNPGSITVACIGGIPSANTAFVTGESDNCSVPTVTFQSESNNSGLGIPANPYILTRIYRVTDAAGNFTDVTQTITAVDNSNHALYVTQPTCSVSTGTIGVTSPTGFNYSYSITGPSGPFTPFGSFTNLAPGTYTVYTRNNTGCVLAVTATASVDPAPSIPGTPVVSGLVNVCAYTGSSTPVTFTASATGNGTQTFNWTLPPNVNLISGAGTNTITVNFPNAAFINQANKQIRLTVINSCGTSPLSIHYLVAQMPNTPAAITASSRDVCAVIGTNASITYTIPKVTAATSYLWITPAGIDTSHLNAPGVNDTAISVRFNSAFVTGNITVRALNDCGTSGIRSIAVTRNDPGTPSPINGPVNVCANIGVTGIPATYSIPAVAGNTYNWSVPAGAIGLTGQGTGSISFTYPSGFISGSVAVTATNGCGVSAARSLSVTKLNPATPGVIDVIAIQPCPGRTFSYTLSSMPLNATSIQWSVPASALSFTGQGTTSITVVYPDGAVAGAVTATAVNNCATSSTRSTAVKLPACQPPGFARQNHSASKNSKVVKDVKENNNTEPGITVMPNPAINDFTILISGFTNLPVEMRITTVAGIIIESKKDIRNGNALHIGNNYMPGAYIAQFIQGDKIKTVKLIKL